MEPGQVLRFDSAKLSTYKIRLGISFSNFSGFAAAFVSIKLESGFCQPTAGE